MKGYEAIIQSEKIKAVRTLHLTFPTWFSTAFHYCLANALHLFCKMITMIRAELQSYHVETRSARACLDPTAAHRVMASLAIAPSNAACPCGCCILLKTITSISTGSQHCPSLQAQLQFSVVQNCKGTAQVAHPSCKFGILWDTECLWTAPGLARVVFVFLNKLHFH